MLILLILVNTTTATIHAFINTLLSTNKVNYQIDSSTIFVFELNDLCYGRQAVSKNK